MKNKKRHAFQSDLLQNYDATELVSLIKAGEFSLAEVTEAVINRIEQVNPSLGAMAYADYALARAKLKSGSFKSSWFAGLPTAIKDNIDVANMPTNQGMRQYLQARLAKKDSVVTQQFKALGFNILGKTQLSELGLSPHAIFKDGSAVLNPWNIDYTSGASSAGAAALVASGALPMAHGNDGGGSIRIPAACCGLVGLKPSRARVGPSEASSAMPIDVISEGVLTRSVRDTANFYAELEKIYRAPKLPPIGLVEGAGRSRWRIGFLLDSITPEPTDKDTRKAVLATASLLSSLGHHVEQAPLPQVQGFKDAFILYYSFMFYMQTRAGRWLVDPSFNRHDVDGLTEGFAKQFIRGWPKFPYALWVLRRETQRFRKLFNQYDVLLTPVVTRTTPKFDYLSPNQPFNVLLEKIINYTGFTPMNNASGLPGISLPMAQTTEGMPIGIHLAADIGQERRLIELAFELEQAQPWKTLAE